MTFRISRSGSFGGLGSLDPFGAGRGGLGRYNLGSDVSSIEAYEAYAIAVGWQNGSVTDDAYLASLQRQWDLAPQGTKEWEGARDKYNDAVYTIARNKIVNRVNLATTSPERVAALAELVAHDQARAAGMTPDNEQRREISARILSTQADIRQTLYADLVDGYNAGRLSTDQLLAAVDGFAAEAAGAPDADDWANTRASLVERKNDEIVASKYQDYQQGRISGADLLAFVDSQMATLVPGSPKYQDLTRKREDLATQLRTEAQNAAHEKLYDAWQAGKISDDTYLRDLAKSVSEAKPGSREEQQAKSRLLETQFSLAEDKLRFDLSMAKTSSAAATASARLLTFYRTALATMNLGSAKARSIQKAIDSLRGATSRGGGGGDGAASGVPAGSKAITAPVPWGKLIKLTKDVNGKRVPVGAIAALMSFDPSVTTERTWYNNNRRMLETAASVGAATWLYIAKDGKSYELPFDQALYSTVLSTATGRFGAWVDAAKTPKAKQAAWSQYITAASRELRVEGDLVMDDYQAKFADAERGKQAALAAMDLGLYMTLVSFQRTLIRAAAGIEGDPGQVPTDIHNATRPLNAADRQTLASDIDAISPYQPRPGTGEPMNPGGDKLLFLQREGILTFGVVPNADGTIETRNLSLDRNQAFVTQDAVGNRKLVTVFDRPDLFTPTSLTDASGAELPPVPAYQRGMTPITAFNDPGLSSFGPAARLGMAPVERDAGLPVWVEPTFGKLKGAVYSKFTTVEGRPVIAAQGAAEAIARGYGAGGPRTAGQAGANSANIVQTGLMPIPDGGVPLWAVRVYGWTPEGGMSWQTWVSVQAPGTANALWLRAPTDANGNVTLTPRVVVTSPTGADFRFAIGKSGGLVMLGADGKEQAIPTGFDWSAYARFYDNRDGLTPATVGMGLPGVDLDWTLADAEGKVNTWRPQSRPESEQVEVRDPLTGALTLRNTTARAAMSEAQQRAADARGLVGASTPVERNVDRWAYYDAGSERWVSGLTPARAGAPNMVPPPPSNVADYPQLGYTGPQIIQGGLAGTIAQMAKRNMDLVSIYLPKMDFPKVRAYAPEPDRRGAIIPPAPAPTLATVAPVSANDLRAETATILSRQPAPLRPAPALPVTRVPPRPLYEPPVTKAAPKPAAPKPTTPAPNTRYGPRAL